MFLSKEQVKEALGTSCALRHAAAKLNCSPNQLANYMTQTIDVELKVAYDACKRRGYKNRGRK